MIVCVIEEARSDIEAGFALYTEIDSDRAVEFTEAITRDIACLKNLIFPHPKKFGLHRALSKKYPFSIYYQFDGKTIRVIGILDQRSSPKKHARLLKGRVNSKGS